MQERTRTKHPSTPNRSVSWDGSTCCKCCGCHGAVSLQESCKLARALSQSPSPPPGGGLSQRCIHSAPLKLPGSAYKTKHKSPPLTRRHRTSCSLGVFKHPQGKTLRHWKGVIGAGSCSVMPAPYRKVPICVLWSGTQQYQILD